MKTCVSAKAAVPSNTLVVTRAKIRRILKSLFVPVSRPPGLQLPPAIRCYDRSDCGGCLAKEQTRERFIRRFKSHNCRRVAIRLRPYESICLAPVAPVQRG
jgi:hypothetical protein